MASTADFNRKPISLICIVNFHEFAYAFDPPAAAEPDLDAPPLERAKPGGYGISLLRSLVDQVNYQFQADGRNELTLSKHRD